MENSLAWQSGSSGVGRRDKAGDLSPKSDSVHDEYPTEISDESDHPRQPGGLRLVSVPRDERPHRSDSHQDGSQSHYSRQQEEEPHDKVDYDKKERELPRDGSDQRTDMPQGGQDEDEAQPVKKPKRSKANRKSQKQRKGNKEMVEQTKKVNLELEIN